MLKKIRNIAICLVMSSIGLGVTGCVKNEQSNAEENGLTILAGSELQSIEPILKDAEQKLGFPISVKYTGTIDGVEEIKAGGDYNVGWFGNAKYFYDTPENTKRIKLSEKIMFSPVIIGVKETAFNKHNLSTTEKYTWKDIASWVKDKSMTYAMTDPSVSNTGYVALMGVVYATADKGENIKIEDVKPEVLKAFFKGQKVTAKSSKWIMDVFNQDPSIDFVVNYESVILNNPTKLVPVYPVEGIVTSDYPMLLLKDSKSDKYKQLVAYLKSAEVQKKLVNEYKYHSFDSDITAASPVFKKEQLLVEMPFNPEQQLSESILNAYFNDYKKPAKFAFVIDTSGSMEGDREIELKSSVAKLVNGELSKFATIRNRESVIIVPFSDKAYDAVVFKDSQKNEIVQYVNQLNMSGGTAMYDAVAAAIAQLQADQKVNGDKYRYSVIVLTDGVTNQGANFEEFKQWYQGQNIKNGDMRVFAISFGSSDIDQLKNLTSITGGNVFNGQKSLGSAFKEIRSYQ